MRSTLHSNIRALALASLLLIPGSFVASPAIGAEAEQTPLGKEMESMGQAWRTLARGLRMPDPASKTAYLEALQQWQVHAVAGKIFVPAHITKMPEADRAAALTAYRTDLAAAIEVSLQLERAMLADDWEKAKELGAKINTARTDGHKKYKSEEPK